MDKAEVVDAILAEVEGRLARSVTQRDRALAEASEANRGFVERAYAEQISGLQTLSLRLRQTEPALRARHAVVEDGALLEVELEPTSGPADREWWFVLSFLAGRVDGLRVGETAVRVHSGELFSARLLGRRTGESVPHPPVHGDGRDRIRAVRILSIS